MLVSDAVSVDPLTDACCLPSRKIRYCVTRPASIPSTVSVAAADVTPKSFQPGTGCSAVRFAGMLGGVVSTARAMTTGTSAVRDDVFGTASYAST